MSTRKLQILALALFVLAVIAGLSPLQNSEGSEAVPQPDPGRFGVAGFLIIGSSQRSDATLVAAPTLKSAIYVPGVDVELRDLLANQTVEKVKTDLSGRFRFAPKKPSRYQACWKARGVVPGCSKIFSIQKSHIYLGPIPIAPETARQARTLFGKVRFSDGNGPRTLEPLLGVNAYAKVFVRDSLGRRLGEAYVNNYGDYVLPGLPRRLFYRLVGNIEGANVNRNVLTPGNSQRVNLIFPQQNVPEIRGLISKDSNGKHWTALPGDTVEVRTVAMDRNGDPLRYRWILPDGSFLPNPANSDTVTFTIPPHNGVYEFTAVVSDGRGGYDKETISISTEGVRFGGIVSATDAATVSGAEVDINGKQTTTDANGRFAIFVPESTRYVMNINKAGYGPISKIYDNGVMGGRWTLTRASVESVDPTQPIDVVNKRTPKDCLGSLSQRSRYKFVGATVQPGATTDKICGPGIRVRIPANALVDENGQPPAGNVNVELTTVDLRSPDGMPGDYTARNSGGNVRVMESSGAGTVEITAGGKDYNLRSGQTAEITIPIDPPRLAIPGQPNVIPLLSYDEQNGIWLEEGQLVRVGNAYVGKVKHFSAINADTLKVNQACIRLETVLLPTQFNVEMTTPQPSGPPSVQTQLVDNGNQRFHVAINLPTNENIQFRVFDLNNNLLQLIDTANPAVSITQVVVNSGGPQSPTTPNRPEFPYAACQKSIELTPFRPVEQAVDEFLHGLYSFEAANLTELDITDPTLSQQFKDAGTAYYNAVDPQNRRDTLNNFKLRNGFPANEINLKYSNSGDLGFGRDMHCRQVSNFAPTGEYACYVTNYGNRFTDDGQDYLDALTNTVPVATVGMEYTRVEDTSDPSGNTLVGSPIVKFYVYKEANANARAVSANLDGTGERPVPQLCMVCHGGHYPNAVQINSGVPAWTDAASANMGSRFIPFDLVNLFMLNPNGVQNQTSLRQLNCDIVRNAAPSTELSDVIASLYGAGCTGNQQIGLSVPGWADANPSTPNLPNKVETYAKVVTPSCRSCHVSQTPSSITWADAGAFSGSGAFISGLICQQHVMPHALITHNRFWLSTNPHQPLLLHNFLNGNDPPGQAGSTAVECVTTDP